MSEKVSGRSNAKDAKVISMADYVKSRLCCLLKSRLCRLMCGKALPFRNARYFSFEATPHDSGTRRSLADPASKLPERRSLSSHQAAKPRVETLL